ncbi:MAG: ester cyclase [Thermomicrobiales bacterium]
MLMIPGEDRMIPQALVLAFIETVWNLADLDAIPRFIAPEYTVEGVEVGPGWVRENVAGMRAGFPDLAIAVERIISDGETVAVLVQVSGTHTGRWKGFAPTGRSVSYREAAFWVVDPARGLIVAGDFVADTLTARVQMGLASPDLWRGTAS